METRGSVSVITLNRPEALNALTTKVGQEFLAAVTQAQANGARAIVLTGAGRAFCAGGDLREMRSMAESGGNVGAFFDEPLQLLNECILAIRQTPLPIIAAVNGVAAGAGANIALACDIVVANESATFLQAFSKIGLIPDSGGTFFLPRLVGMQRAAALMITADKVTAADAVTMGMIYKSFPDDVFEAESKKMAQTLAEMPTKGIGYTKRLLNESYSNNLEQQLKREKEMQKASGATEDFREGVMSFLEKRKPQFKGK